MIAFDVGVAARQPLAKFALNIHLLSLKMTAASAIKRLSSASHEVMVVGAMATWS